MVVDASLLNTQHYKVWIKDKVALIQEMELRPLRHLGFVATEKGNFGLLSTTVVSFTYLYKYRHRINGVW